MSRISELPRRDWKALAAPFVEPLSSALRTPSGTQTLRLGQTSALLEGPTYGGLVKQGRVGIGKTLTLALAPRVLGCTRPLIVTAGGLLFDTDKAIKEMRQHWQIPADLQLMSYTALSNFYRKGLTLRSIWPEGPDYCGLDEAQNVAYVRKSAVAKLFREWTEECPECVFFDVTGSFDLDGMPTFAHLFDWSLREGSPLPRTPHEVDKWSGVIDEGDERNLQAVNLELGIDKRSTIEQCREAFRERLIATPGVIIDDTPYTAVPLEVNEILFDVGLDAEFQKLRELGQRPDGFDVMPDDVGAEDDEDSGAQPDRVANGRIGETARQLASGFFYKLRFPAPAEWLAKRRAYFKLVRREIDSGLFKTEAQVRAACIEEGERKWLDWAAIQPTFEPQFVTHWLSDALVDAVREWGAKGPGVIWTEHIALGPYLQEKTGWTYYGGKGRSSDGRRITEGARPSREVVIASRRANGVGRNLQFQWARCLFIQLVGKSYMFEQAVGRFHREGLETWSKNCRVDVLMRCSEDFRARQKVLASAQKTCQSFYSQKAGSVPWEKVSKPRTGWAFQ